MISVTYEVSVYKTNLLFHFVDRVYGITLYLLQISLEKDLWGFLSEHSGSIYADALLVWINDALKWISQSSLLTVVWNIWLMYGLFSLYNIPAHSKAFTVDFWRKLCRVVWKVIKLFFIVFSLTNRKL